MEASPFADVDHEETPMEKTVGEAVEITRGHVKKLADIEQTINEAIAEVFDSPSDPVGLAVFGTERVQVPDLVATDNELFDKVMKVLAYLCDEVQDLKETAERRLYAPLALFGAKADEDEDVKDGELELEMGRHLPFFQDVANFVDRCQTVALNTVHQLTALYSGKERLYTHIYRYVQLVPVFEALADIFQVLVTIDYIVQDNAQIGEAWNLFKRMMQHVRGDPGRFGIKGDGSAPAPAAGAGEDGEGAEPPADPAVAKVDELFALMVRLDATVMAGACFEACVQQDYEPIDETGAPLANVRGNAIFMGELLARVQSSVESLQNSIGSAMETNEKERLVGVFGLYVLHRHLLPTSQMPDKDLYARLWRIQERVPIATLYGKVVWTADVFLTRYARYPAKKLVPKDPVENRNEWTRNVAENFARTVARIHMQLASWVVTMDMRFAKPTSSDGSGHNKRVAELLRARGQVLMEGLVLAYQASHVLRNFMNLHLVTGTPIRKRNLQPLAQAVELLKVIENEFRRKAPVIAESVPHILRGFAHDLLLVFRPVRAKLEGGRKLDESKRECVAAIRLLEATLQTNESMTSARRTVVALAMRVALMKNGPAYADAANVGRKLWMMNMLAQVQVKVAAACDCGFLYWNRELLPALLQDVFEAPEQARRLRYLVAGFGDASTLLQAARAAPSELYDGSGMSFEGEGGGVPVREDLLAKYKEYVMQTMEEEVVRPTCNAVERDLRLHVHSVHLSSVASVNPKSGEHAPIAKVLQMPAMRVFDSVLDIRSEVTHYLGRTFYNLTTVALHDWKTYGEMASLAREKYGLHLVDNHLPMGSLDQGLDVLAIMRNIHVFVARYNYNLNQQFFIEKKPDRGAKHLNSVSLESISASIRTHGIGMMSTTVNFVYQFLRKKFNVFDQFLFDDYIKSYLGKERRWFKKNKDNKEVDNQYPYSRAFEFTRDIRKLGMVNNLSFLDKFRLLITQIGNALGYVRMVRSAGMHQCASAVKFVPDLKRIISFETYAGKGGDGSDGGGGEAKGEGEGDAEGEVEGKGTEDAEEGEGGSSSSGKIKGAHLSEETVVAAQRLDGVVKSLTDNFAEGADYLKVLVEAVASAMGSDDRAHLKSFFVIVPALTINHVESTLFAKDRLDKSVKGKETYFTDDGFAIGIAYLLAVLQQNKAFDSLHWFDCVRAKYAEDRRTLEMQLATLQRSKRGSSYEETLHELQFKNKRLDALIREFSLLYFSLSGARIFFKDS